MNCKDCGLDIPPEQAAHAVFDPADYAHDEGGHPVTPEALAALKGACDLHADLCCDCFDEQCGMEPEKRTRPRPARPDVR